MNEILDSKKMTGVALAEAVGLSAATISGINTLGVAGRSIAKWVKFFKFKDERAMREAAYEWWVERNPKGPSRANEPAVAEAIANVKALHPLVTDVQIQLMLARFSDAAFSGRDHDFWFRALLEEVKQDYMRTARQAGEQHQAAWEAAQPAKQIQTAFRQAPNEKRALVERAETEAEAVKDRESEPTERVAPRQSGNVPKRQRRHG